MRTKSNLGLIAACVIAVGFTIQSWRARTETQRQRDEIALQDKALSGRAASLTALLQTTRSAVADVERTAAMLTEPGTSAGSPKVGAASAASAKPSATGRKLSPSSIVASDPRKMAEYAKNYRDSLDLSLGGMFRKLGLTPEQIEKVKAVKVWREQARMDLEGAAEMEELNMQAPRYYKLLSEIGKERRRREAEIFDEGELLKRYRELSNPYLRETTSRLASIELWPNTPATFAQVERATEIILASKLRQEVGWSWQDWAAINWEVAGPQLQRELSPAQYTRLRQLLDTQAAWTAVAARNVAIQNEATRLMRKPGG